MGVNEGHGTKWLFDAREDHIEVGDEVLFAAEGGVSLYSGYVKIIRSNGSVLIAGEMQNFDRWARDVVLLCAGENVHRFVGHRGGG